MTEKNNDKVVTGMITKGVGGLYTVRCDDGCEVTCLARGVFRYENMTPLVGDRVEVLSNTAAGEDEQKKNSPGYVIEKILERNNSLIRPALANLTHLFVVVPCARPKPDIVTVDKLVSIADSKDIEPVIIVNKADIEPDEALRIKEIYTKAGFSCFILSARTGEGCDALLEYLEKSSNASPTVSAFAGASAAGKSTLMTKLFPDLKLKTGEVSRKTQRGRHTTRHVELFSVLENGRCFVADTPGFSLLDFARYNFYELSELPWSFREFRESLGKCRYTKCTHTKEEGCEILRRVNDGEISRQRHESYVALYEEIKKVPEWKRKQEQSCSR